MSNTLAEDDNDKRAGDGKARIVTTLSSWMLIGLLAWSPFPLGSNRPWSWDLLIISVCLIWVFSVPTTARGTEHFLKLLRRLALPTLLYGAVLLWGLIQTIGFVPASWTHPIWQIASTSLAHPVTATISINPWETRSSLLKLAAYALFAVLTAHAAEDSNRAARILTALITITFCYAAYALILSALNLHQDELFYSIPSAASKLSAPFVNRNSFATYMGLGAICSAAQLVRLGYRSVHASLGKKQFVLSLTQYLFGPGTLPFIAAIGSFTALIASGSRAGFLSTLLAMVALLALSARMAAHRMTIRAILVTGLVLIFGAVALFISSGTNLEEHLNTLFDSGGPDDLRIVLSQAALRMIADAPWLGLGLGTFQDAYPLYAERFFPFVMDKAHNDYLELAAGLGLPAAIALLAAISLLALRCYRGVFERRRNQIYPMLGLAASILVAVHSAFDFSLQIPAVALTYAAILGLGVGQSFSSRQS